MARTLPALALALTLTACRSLLANQPELPPPVVSAFPDVFAPPSSTPAASASPVAVDAGGTTTAAMPAPSPTASYDPFLSPGLVNVDTPTTFIATFGFSLSSQRAGDAPAVTTDIFQGGLELQVGEVDTLIEGGDFHFEKLSPGLKIGDGRMDVGLPVQLSVPISMNVIETDNKSSALVSIKAESALAHVYLADVQIRKLYGSLALVSLANSARASAAQGQPLLPHAARVVQTIAAGYIQLPAKPGDIRTRVVVKSVPDPTTQVAAQHVIDGKVTLSP